MKIAITYPHHALLTTTVNVLEMLTEANHFNRMLNPGNPQTFYIQLLGEQMQMPHSYGNTSLRCDAFDQKQQDLVVVPAIKANLPEVFGKNLRLIEYLRQQYDQGATMVSMCSGALLLAEAGILNHKTAATHWAYSELAKKRYPTVSFEFERPFIDLGNIITSTGAFSSNALIIYLIEKFGGRELALFTSRMYLTDYSVSHLQYFIPINLKLNHTNERILRIQRFILDHFNQDISVDNIAERFHMSHRNLTKTFKETIGLNPSEYIQLVRIKKATELLESSEKNIKEIMYETGYNDGSAFRKTFKKIVGLVPTDTGPNSNE